MVEIIASDDCKHLYVICMPYNIMCVFCTVGSLYSEMPSCCPLQPERSLEENVLNSRQVSCLSPIMHGCDEEVVLVSCE
jgi:hypothetical protein